LFYLGREKQLEARLDDVNRDMEKVKMTQGRERLQVSVMMIVEDDKYAFCCFLPSSAAVLVNIPH